MSGGRFVLTLLGMLGLFGGGAYVVQNWDEVAASLPFEVVSMLLLAAMIGCIVIAIKIKLPPQHVLPGRGVDEIIEIKVPEEIETV